MTENKEVYPVPVYKSDGERIQRNEQTTTKNSDEYVSVEHIKNPTGYDELLAQLHGKGQKIDYRFRVENHTLRRTSYLKDEPREIPVDVQHAITRSGYGIEDLCHVDNRYFEWLEGNAIRNQIELTRRDYVDYPLLKCSLDNLTHSASMIRSILLARYGLNSETYWETWLDTANESDEINRRFYHDLLAQFKTQLMDTHVSTLVPPPNSLTPIPRRQRPNFVETENGEYVLIDVIWPWAAHRFEFERTAANEWQYIGPKDIQVPVNIVRMLAQNGIEIENCQSIYYAGSGSDIVGHYARWAHRLGDNLLPATLQGTQQDLILRSEIDALGASAILSFFEEEWESATNLHSQLCSEYGISSQADVSMNHLKKFASKLIQEMPDRFLPST